MDVIDVYAPMPPEPARPAAEPAPRRCRLGFTGTGAEYFGIWIVNLLLTIVTLGIYSAWAKVRKMRYFYRNTHLDGSVFDYHGDAVAILKGRILAVLLVILYKLSMTLLGAFALVVLVGLIAVLPWLLTQSYRFRLHNSSYRGLRFRFDGPLWQAYLILGVPIVVFLAPGALAAFGPHADPRHVDPKRLTEFGAIFALTYLALMVAWPYLHFSFKRWQHGHALYGVTRARFEATAGSFYGPYLAAAGILLVLLVVGGIVIGVFVAGSAMHAKTPPDPRKITYTVAIFAALFYLAAFSIGPVVTAWIQNAVWSNTRVEDLRLNSDVRAGRLIGITLGNLFMVVLSLGLLIPFAVVRLMKYKIESIEVLDADALKRFVGAGTGAGVGTAGEGAVDVMDLDFGL
jgi:uncharacterized membrane protein YjgN (DUF898 family)